MSLPDTRKLGCWLGQGMDNAMARRVFGAISNGVTISDATLPGAPLIYVNPAFERMTGYSGEEIAGMSCSFLQGIDRDQPGVHRIRAAVREAREERALLRNYRKDGTLFWNEMYLSPVFDAGGTLTHFVGVQNDVTAETEAKRQLAEERERLHAAAECSTDGLYICEAVRNETGEIIDFTFVFLNSSAEKMVSIPISTLLGGRMCELLPVNHTLGLLDLYKRVVLTGEPLVHEFAIDDENVRSSWLRVQVRKLKDGIVINASDITLYSAQHDPLTALPNRSVLRDRIEQGMLRARRYGLMLGVFLIDLDGFKAINDTLGHAAGDETLITVAHRLSNCMREVDSVIRMGGDEFVVVMPDLRRRSDAKALAARILNALRLPMRIAGRDVSVTSSIGIAIYPDSAKTAEELLSRADTAMYKAKRGGKNQYELFPIGKEGAEAKPAAHARTPLRGTFPTVNRSSAPKLPERCHGPGPSL
jgi:diguanylate cyclase (GGDEF)-like protein/PAS domain S-box-containing protein